jgi:hypothetical protein
MLAAIRPDSWNFPLFLHVFGAMTVTGAVLTMAVALVLAWRSTPDLGQAASLRRFAFRTFLLAVIPAFLIMRIAAEWIASKEHFGGDDDPAWIGIGYMVGDGSFVLLVIAGILGGLASRREGREPGAGARLGNIAGVLGVIVVVGYVVAIWAMGGKPS